MRLRNSDVGEMRVQKVGAEWRIFVIAAGAPRGPATAADCGLIAAGAIEGKTFQGEIKYIFDNTDSKRRRLTISRAAILSLSILT